MLLFHDHGLDGLRQDVPWKIISRFRIHVWRSLLRMLIFTFRRNSRIYLKWLCRISKDKKIGKQRLYYPLDRLSPSFWYTAITFFWQCVRILLIIRRVIEFIYLIFFFYVSCPPRSLRKEGYWQTNRLFIPDN